MGAIRLFLALVVAVGHLRQMVVDPANLYPGFPLEYALVGLNAGYAVVYFYMVSGFLMSYSLTYNHAPTLSGNVEYYRSRFIRIFSLYWPVLLFAYLKWGFPSSSPGAILTGTFLFGSDWYESFGSYPEQDWTNFPPPLQPAWSLGAELTFYAFAPFLIRSLPASICVLCFSLASRLSFVYVYGFHATWTYHFFPATVMFFILGHLSRLIWEKLSPSPWLGVGLLVASACISTAGIKSQTWDNLYFYAAILCFAASLPGVFELTKRVRWLNLTGNLSYPLYLTHKLTISIIFPLIGIQAFRMWRPAEAHLGIGMKFLSIGIMLAICVIVALLVHLAIETRLARLMHRFLPGAAPRRQMTRPIQAPAVAIAGSKG